MATYTKEFLSSATGEASLGPMIKIDSISSGAPKTLHMTNISSSIKDEVWIYATNSGSVSANLSIVFDNEEITSSIPSKSGLTLVVPGLLINGDGNQSAVISAYASVANVISVSGYVNRIS